MVVHGDTAWRGLVFEHLCLLRNAYSSRIQAEVTLADLFQDESPSMPSPADRTRPALTFNL